MSRADDLHDAMDSALVLNKTWAFDSNGKVMVDMQAIARAICEHLGIDWGVVDGIDDKIRCPVDHPEPCEDCKPLIVGHRTLTTLLEAAAIPRDLTSDDC